MHRVAAQWRRRGGSGGEFAFPAQLGAAGLRTLESPVSDIYQIDLRPIKDSFRVSSFGLRQLFSDAQKSFTTIHFAPHFIRRDPQLGP